MRTMFLANLSGEIWDFVLCDLKGESELICIEVSNLLLPYQLHSRLVGWDYYV